VGTFGEIWLADLDNGSVEARTWYRDDDGKSRQVRATGPTDTAAKIALKAAIATRGTRSGFGDLTRNSSFTDLVDLWLEDLDLEDSIAESTRALYERNMRQLVMPAFENFTLRECTVGRVDRFLKSVAKNGSPSMAKQAKTVLSLAFGLAVRYEALPSNPVRDTKRIKKADTETVALTLDQIHAIRTAASEWRREDGLPGPKPDGQLEAIIEVMLGTSCRIGEVLALRKCDVDVESDPVRVSVRGTIVYIKGKGTFRQPRPKTSSSARTVAVPSWTAKVLRERLAKIDGERSDHLVFFSRNGTPLTTANVRRRLRAVLAKAKIEGVSPHAFRRTVATELERSANVDLAAKMLGHTSTEITRKHYIEKDDQVDPVTAQILERLAPVQPKPAKG
jgi:integrase